MMQFPTAFELVAKSADFLMKSRADVFTKWPKPTLIKWLQYHMEQRGVAIVADGGVITGVAVGWRSQMPDIDDRWARWDDNGDCFYIDQLHAQNPAALRNLICLFEGRIPEWHQLTLLAERRRKRVRIRPAVVERLFTFSDMRS